MAKRSTPKLNDLLETTSENSASDSKSEKSPEPVKTKKSSKKNDIDILKKETKTSSKTEKKEKISDNKKSKKKDLKKREAEVVKPAKESKGPKVIDYDSMSESSSESSSDEEVSTPVAKTSSKCQKSERKKSIEDKPTVKKENKESNKKAKKEVIAKPIKVEKSSESEDVDSDFSEATDSESEIEVKAPVAESSLKKVKTEKKKYNSDSESSSNNESESKSVSVKQEKKPAEKNNSINQKNDGVDESGPTEVIISNMQFNTTEEDIKKHFKKCNNLLQVRIMMGQDGRPRGKAFLKFDNYNDVRTAIKENESSLNGRQIFVEQTRPRDNNTPRALQNQPVKPITESNNVIVRNLAFSITEDVLKSTFNKCGEIKQVRIMTGEDGRSRGFGFVDFFNVESARSAKALNGNNLQGRSMNIDFSLPRGPGGYQGGNQNGNRSNFGGSRQNNNNNFNNQRKGFTESFKGEEVDL